MRKLLIPFLLLALWMCAPEKAETWRVSELCFTASRNYDTGGGDRVMMDVEFSNKASGQTLVIPAFWDGEDRFVVRFAPPSPGRWKWKSRCPEDAALDGRKGTLRCREYSGPLEVYRHGFVKAEKGTKYLMYADGTPFFYLGDTHWGMYTEALSEEHFKRIVRRRVEQGFTVIQSEPIGAPFHLQDGRVDADDIAGFRQADAYYRFIADAGLVHANAEFFFPSDLTEQLASDDEALKALCRYWVARFGAYPVLWTLAQEIDNDSYAELGGRFFDYRDNPWVKIAEYIHAADPYSHPLSGHQENAVNTSVTGAGTEPEEAHADGYGVSVFLPEPVSERTGHNWWAAQWSPSLHETPGPEAVRDYWLSDRPAVNYEGRYCGLWTMNFGSRAQGWISFLSGFCGYGYGAADIWLYHSGFDATTTSFDGVEHITPEMKAVSWQESLEYPSAFQMRHLRDLLESFDWWNLVPVIPGDPVFRDASGAAVYARTPREHLLYFYGKGTETGRISTLPPEGGTDARWYDPRTGGFREAALPVRESDGYWALPPKPDGQDWVLVLRVPETASRPFPLPVDESRSMLARWAKKEVKESLLLDDMEQEGRWKVLRGKPELSYTRENCKDGLQALRHRISLVDRERLAAFRTPWGTFRGEQGGWTSVALEFDRPQDWRPWNRLSLWVYIHPSRNPNVSFALDLVTDVPDGILTPGRETNVDIPQGKWVQVLWEIDALPRERVLRLEFCYDDWCIARMAESLGQTDLAAEYDARSLRYRNLLDPSTGFFRGKDSDGNWRTPFDPEGPSRDYTEAIAWQYRHYVPHDLRGYTDLMGGPGAVRASLDSLFADENRPGCVPAYGSGGGFAFRRQRHPSGSCTWKTTKDRISHGPGSAPLPTPSNPSLKPLSSIDPKRLHATAHEIWIEPESRFVGTLTLYLKARR